MMSMKADVSQLFAADANGNITAILPGVTSGDHHIVVRTDIKNNIRESDITNNSLVSADVMTVDVPSLTGDVPLQDTSAEGQMKYYRIDVDAGLDLRVTFTSDLVGASNEVYIACNRVPTLSDFDYAGTLPFSSSQEALVPSTEAGTYYIMMLARDLPSGVISQDFTLLIEPMSFSISGITPDVGGAGGRVTCTLIGAGFRDTTQVFLRQADDSLLEGTVVEFVSTMQLRVRWNLDEVALGTYDLVVVNPNDLVGENPEGLALSVTESTGMQLETTSTSGNSFRVGSVAPFTFTFSNTGNVDIPYLIIHILVPTDVLPVSIVNTDALFARTDVVPGTAGEAVEDFRYVYSEFDDDGFIGFNLIELVGKDIAPGEAAQSAIVFANFRPPQFPIAYLAEALEVEKFIERILARIERLRLSVLESPGEFDDAIVALATDPNAFESTLLSGYCRSRSA